jgi:dihydrofolate synthase/folylpolyglutamate synthase
LLNVKKNTGLLGRWQVLQENPKVVCDTGHNRDGLVYVMKQLSEQVFDKLHMVFGVVKDKDLNSIIDLLPKKATYYFCKPNIPRGLNANELKRVFNDYGLKGETYNSVNEAYKIALEKAEINDFVFVGGSTFVVAEII